ncbi:MAG: DUF1189 family protein [Nitrospirae bacterium]|nr:DUF1189 family protein [Nitrospirota bacterium]
MPEQKYTAYQGLYLSFFSRPFYRDVALNWRGTGFGFLLALLALCIIPGVLRVQNELSVFVNDEGSLFIKQLPEISIAKGVLSVNAPQPYVIKNEKTGEPFMIIDTTGSVNSLSGTKAVVLLTKTAFVIRKSDRESRTFSLSDLDSEVIRIDRFSARDFLDSLVESFPLVFYPIALLMTFLLRAAEAMIYWAFALMLSRSASGRLDGKGLLRVSVVSMTPVLLSGAVLLTVGLEIPYWWLISFLVPLLYVSIAVRTIFKADIPGAAE